MVARAVLVYPYVVTGVRMLFIFVLNAIAKLVNLKGIRAERFLEMY